MNNIMHIIYKPVLEELVVLACCVGGRLKNLV